MIKQKKGNYGPALNNYFLFRRMMKNLIFATNNEHKVAEIRSSLGNLFQVVSLKEAEIYINIEEPYDTLEENAREKSSTIHRLTHQDCFSEDTGLFVDALNGEPGVKSARYAGEPSNNKANIEKLLLNLTSYSNRTALFKTIISLVMEDKEYLFEGICEGSITLEPIGSSGFGYDAIFIPAGSSKSFGEMSIEEKNQYSHRKKAVAKLISFLREQGNI